MSEWSPYKARDHNMITTTSRSGSNTAAIYFPLDQGERAKHPHVNQLLPRDVYERLADLIRGSLPPKSVKTGSEAEFLATKGHQAVFIDGDRGTGKTTVAVNLRAYLESNEAKNAFGDLASDVHVLNPIDPTQLEDSDDLFLNVIVAAVLSDEHVRKAQEHSPSKRQALYEKLQALGSALQGRETQKENFGLDRLRSFMGTQALAYAVHDFFSAALSLLDKRMFAMPIDDVDTSLHKAFDYLEVVRRYLSSALVLPIVCGDFSLYRAVTQRDSFRRFTVEGRRYDRAAEEVTSKLAVEYLRKVLPVQRRLQMPDIGTLLNDSRILLLPPGEQGPDNRVSIPQFLVWLRALLEGPVNGHENSTLHIPIPTVRALSQLVGSVQKQFPALEAFLHNKEPARPSTDLLKRLLRTLAGSRTVGSTPRDAHDAVERPRILEPDAPLTAEWGEALLEHFRFAPDGGYVCLVLLASRHWRNNTSQSVLATPLFAPLTANEAPELRYSERNAKIQWRDELQGRVPSPWLAELPGSLAIPFATPEIGRAVRFSVGAQEPMPAGSMTKLLINLVVHRNFYSQSQQASLLCIGRILEILVTSLVRDISIEDIERILAESPFHSVAAIARTKAISISGEEEKDSPEQDVEPPLLEGIDQASLGDFARSVNRWREEKAVNQLVLSPWLIYCSVNKTLNQAAFFNRPATVGDQPRTATWRDAIDLGLAAFNAFWAACASFEKGPTFGLPLVLSNVNLTIAGDFEMNTLYKQNVWPLVSQAVIMAPEGDQVISVTKLLATHPLRELIKHLRDQLPKREPEAQTAGSREANARSTLLEELGLRKDMAQLREITIVNALRRMHPDADSARKHGRSLLRRFSDMPGIQRELRTLERAIRTIN